MKENPQSLPRLVPMVIDHERRNGLVPTSVRTNPFLLISVFLAKDIIIGLLNNAVSVESCFKKHGYSFGFKNGGKSITPESAFPSSSSSREVPSTNQLHTVDTQGSGYSLFYSIALRGKAITKVSTSSTTNQMGIDAFSWLHKRDKYKSDFGIVLKFTNCNVIPIVEIQHCYSRHISWEKPPDSFDGLSCGKAMAGQSSRAGCGVF